MLWMYCLRSRYVERAQRLAEGNSAASRHEAGDLCAGGGRRQARGAAPPVSSVRLLRLGCDRPVSEASSCLDISHLIANCVSDAFFDCGAIRVTGVRKARR